MSRKADKLKAVIFAGVVGPATIGYGIGCGSRSAVVLGILCSVCALLAAADLVLGHFRGRKGSGELDE